MAVETTAPSVPRPADFHRFSVDEYRALVETGALEDARVEMLHGFVVEMSPRNYWHDELIRRLTDWLYDEVDRERFVIRNQSGLSLSGSQPEPDLAVIAGGTPRPWHPRSAELLIEVAISSQRRDLVEKPPVYAAADVTEYWVVDVPAERVVVHREPRRGAYAGVTELRGEAELRLDAVGGNAALTVAELLAE